MNWLYASACEQRAALERGEISSLELLEKTIAHSEELIPFINPIAIPLYERAKKAALKADKQWAKRKAGPLCGIPVTIKDSQWMAGVRCSNGAMSLKEFIPQQTSQAVQRLEDAGAVIFAKTTCPEYSLSGITDSKLYGLTTNPWDITKTPGGSSGGGAAAVAAGIGSLSLGGDGGGSIRIPAAFCGIAGFKPGFGVVPRKPGFDTWESIISYGPMARNVADLELMFDVLAGKNSSVNKQHNETAKNISVIASEDLGFVPLDDDVRSAFWEVIRRLQESGSKVKMDHPGMQSSIVTWTTTASYDMWQHKSEMLESNHELGIYAKEFIKFGSTFSETDFADAQEQRTKIHDAYMALFQRNRAKILITPTLGCEAFSHDRIHPTRIGEKEITFPWLDWAGFLYDANLTGLPACSIPMGVGDEGMPLSLQVMGSPGSDTEVLRVARYIEGLLAWQHPEFSAAHYTSHSSEHVPSEPVLSEALPTLV